MLPAAGLRRRLVFEGIRALRTLLTVSDSDTKQPTAILRLNPTKET